MSVLVNASSLPRVIEELTRTLLSFCNPQRIQSGSIAFQRGEEEFLGTSSTSLTFSNQQEALANFQSGATACVRTIEENAFDIREPSRVATFSALFGLPRSPATLVHGGSRAQVHDDADTSGGLLGAVAATALVAQPPAFLAAKRKALEVCTTAVLTFGGVCLHLDTIPSIEVCPASKIPQRSSWAHLRKEREKGVSRAALFPEVSGALACGSSCSCSGCSMQGHASEVRVPTQEPRATTGCVTSPIS